MSEEYNFITPGIKQQSDTLSSTTPSPRLCKSQTLQLFATLLTLKSYNMAERKTDKQVPPTENLRQYSPAGGEGIEDEDQQVLPTRQLYPRGESTIPIFTGDPNNKDPSHLSGTSNSYVVGRGRMTILRDLELNVLKERYWRFRAEFLQSDQALKVKDLFENTILKQKGINIDRAICIGLGSFSWHNEDDNYPMGANVMSQLAAFDYWVELLERGRDKRLLILFQDPYFGRKQNLKLLCWLGYEKCISASEVAAQQCVTKDTFLFIPCGDKRELIRQCLQVAHPALMIGHSIEEKKNCKVFAKYISPGILGLQKKKPKIPQPGSPKFATQQAERQITRPFYSTHARRPLWPYPALESIINEEEGPITPQTEEIFENKDKTIAGFISVSLRWTREMWVYWRPDFRGDLKRFGDEEDMGCECPECQWRLVRDDFGIADLRGRNMPVNI